MFKLTFQDGTVEGGKSTDGSWKIITSTKPILKFEYWYTYQKKLLLSGYKEYNHLVEKVAALGSQEVTISKIFLMGRTETTTDIFTIDLKTRQCTKKTVAVGEEYNGQTTTGWKPGVYKNPGNDIG